MQYKKYVIAGLPILVVLVFSVILVQGIYDDMDELQAESKQVLGMVGKLQTDVNDNVYRLGIRDTDTWIVVDRLQGKVIHLEDSFAENHIDIPKELAALQAKVASNYEELLAVSQNIHDHN